ncbi:hypothetical protein [Peribacillus frigoritolerans]|uniref:hypothetical protein n=1 Tax=Peribacillus frigoritolerans TaxID=450367 RepID=UPI0021612C15|nr:hypothetical protein [Peribacillus frigoritolerans]
MIQIDKKKALQFVILTLLLMAILPILINLLMFQHYFPVIGDEPTWISSLSSIWGAIIGGIISGALTLIGVNVTIKNQINKEFHENMPIQLMNLEDIITFLDRCISKLNRDKIQASGILDVMKYTFSGLEEDGLLKKSSTVNLKTYRAVRNLYDFLNHSLNPKEISAYSEGDIRKAYQDCIISLINQHKYFEHEIFLNETKGK